MLTYLLVGLAPHALGGRIEEGWWRRASFTALFIGLDCTLSSCVWIREKKFPLQQLSTKAHEIKSLEEKSKIWTQAVGAGQGAAKLSGLGAQQQSLQTGIDEQWGSDCQEKKIGNEKPQRASKSRWNLTEREPVFYSKSSGGLKCKRNYFSNWGQHDFITKYLFSCKTRSVVKSKV